VRTLVAGRNIYLTDRGVIGRINMADMNEVMFARVNKVIPGFQGMEWLKVSAAIDTYGDTVTAENLSFPGQKFTGSVSASLVEGIFEVAPPLYDGSGAPPFPANYTSVPELIRYLAPELMIESDDPLVKAEAARITEGAVDSWDAVLRLSRWVSENIMGALPGGGSALNTLKMREAECGGHSRLLTAFCRSVGIPARLATGCLYVPYYNGSFGQHAWTEIYMGEAGWIPVDATIHETDHINAGHIRLGEKATFQPRHMEILDYRIKQ
jgi:transglutaminase-like putative cysteine protease